MPDFEIRTSMRFRGDFAVYSLAAQLQPEEQKCIDRIHALLERFSEEEVSDATGEEFADMLDQTREIRDEICQGLKSRVSKWTALPADAQRIQEALELSDACLRLEGIYDERRLRLTEIPFTVVPVTKADQSNYVDIAILTRDVKIPTDKQQFKVEFDHALMIVKAVFSERKPSSWERLASCLRKLKKQPAEKKEELSPRDARLHECLDALNGIAEVGLMNLDKSQTAFAQLALNGFKSEFVAREAGIVKNAHVARLGSYTAIAILLSIIFYLAASNCYFGFKLYHYRNFFLLSAGTALGTWLSFSIRRVVLTFDDLALLEEDRLRPPFRIAFMIGITFVLGLLLWNRAIGLAIGDFTTDISRSGTAALLIGALSGIAERAMALAVGKQANDFSSRIGAATRQ